MTRQSDRERGIEPLPAPLVIREGIEAVRLARRIADTPRMGDARALSSGYEDGWIVAWYPKGKRWGNAYVMPDGTAWDHQLERTVKTGLPVDPR